MSEKFSLSVNGSTHSVTADPDTPLLYVLRDDLGLNNPHFGCGLRQCGACTVHLDGQPIRSCVTPVSAVGNGKIRAQILGQHAELQVISTPVFYFRVPPGREGAGDLVLVKLKQKSRHREFEISAEKEWTPSSGISLKSQVEFYEKQVESGLYRLVPADDLDPGEYGFYQYRGRELPGFLYAFQVE